MTCENINKDKSRAPKMTIYEVKIWIPELISHFHHSEVSQQDEEQQAE